ncbi:GTP binding domain containing protein [Aphelenchoides avenae]|nr:GTP binding domain containing protein [Aphelenchus avenae]
MQGPFMPEKFEPHEWRYYDNTTTIAHADGTRWTKDTRTHFSIPIPDETLEHLGVALGLNVSRTHVEVVLTRDVLRKSQLKVLPGLNAVDAYVIIIENSSDVAESRASFVRHDREVVSHHLHASKWASRKGQDGGHCEYDAWKKAFDTITRPGGSLTRANWSESELRVLGQYDLLSMKPVIYVVNVSREEYIRQDPVFVASTEEWVHENLPGEAQSPVFLTSVELEEQLAKNASSLASDVVSVFDGILDSVFRYLRLVRLYAIRDNNVRLWYIPPNTPAYMAAGVVFHRSCLHCKYGELSRGCTRDFCTTHYDHFDTTSAAHLSSVDVVNASVISGPANATLTDQEFVAMDRYYRVQEGDVLKFSKSNKAVEGPEEQCAGLEDTRPRLLHPVGSELRICIAGLTNTGKTTLFNNLTCSDAEVSPKVFTTRHVMSRTTKLADDRFKWLAKNFPKATLHPPQVTVVDTPAFLQGYDDLCNPLNLAPWKREVNEALKQCDIIYLVSREFNDSSGSGYKGSDVAAYKLMRTQDWKVLRELRDNATLRNDLDELDVLDTIEDNLRGHDQSGRQLGFPVVITDQRARYHDWSESELAVLERIRLLSAKPMVYVLNLDKEDFANSSHSETVLEARKYFGRNDRDALVLPFTGHHSSAPNTSLLGVGECGANTLLEKTLDHYQLGHFYTANAGFVAAWTFKLGMTFREAVELVNATLDANVTVVEVANMREVIEAGSVEKAQSLDVFRRRTFDDEVEDGDILVLTPGELHEVHEEFTNPTSATALPSPGSAAKTGGEGRCIASWGYAASLALNFVLLMVLAIVAVASSPNVRKRMRSFIAARLRRRERGQDALLGEVRYETEGESINMR